MGAATQQVTETVRQRQKTVIEPVWSVRSVWFFVDRNEPDELDQPVLLVQPVSRDDSTQTSTSLICPSGTMGECHAGCSKNPSSKAAASEEARRTLRYVELLSDARTKLEDFFSILLVKEASCMEDSTTRSVPLPPLLAKAALGSFV